MTNEKPTNPSHGESDARIAEIQERESKATKGPWSISPSDEGKNFSHIDSEDWTAFARVVTRMEGDEQECRENADFIAHARADIPFLLEQLAELRSLILGKMGDGEEELAAILRFEGEGDEWFIPAEPGPLGPFPFVEAVKEFVAFMDREFSKLDATASRLQSELEEARKEIVAANEAADKNSGLIDKWKDRAESLLSDGESWDDAEKAIAARLAAQEEIHATLESVHEHARGACFEIKSISDFAQFFPVTSSQGGAENVPQAEPSKIKEEQNELEA